jgi:hypothetical protein
MSARSARRPQPGKRQSRARYAANDDCDLAAEDADIVSAV